MKQEEINQKAIKEYAVKEFNNLINACDVSEENIFTSRSYLNAMEYHATTKRLLVISCGMRIKIENPVCVARDDIDGVSIYGKSTMSCIDIDTQTVIRWLSELSEQTENKI